MPINPDQRAMIKKYLRLVENEVDKNVGIEGPRTCNPWWPRLVMLNAGV